MIIGGGFAGLSAACFLANAGLDVTVLEKHSIAGGRARTMKAGGFTFDMGPSWYWMPDVFDRFFGSFGKKVSDYYQLNRLDPSYRIYWKDGVTDIPADYTALKELFEQTEPGSGRRLDSFLREAAYKYRVGMQKLVYKPGRSILEFLDPQVLVGLIRLDVFTSMRRHVARHFSHPRLRQLLEFPVLFLGALAADTPALYSLMNYADIQLGTWYPQGGMYRVVEAMQALATELGVKFQFGRNGTRIRLQGDRASSVVAVRQGWGEESYPADVVLGAADYHFIEMNLLPPEARTYKEAYWQRRVMAPSCLLYFVGLKRKLAGIRHHSLFFDTDFEAHGRQIYRTREWPSEPLFYVSAPSVTDPAVAPADHENLFFLIPVSSGLEGDTDALREDYFDRIVTRYEKRTGQAVRTDIVYKKNYSIQDFAADYNSFKGNAYGLANTLRQTAFLKPSCRSSRIKNLFYTGQLTVPGPGVPPSLVSGEVVAREVLKYCARLRN